MNLESSMVEVSTPTTRTHIRTQCTYNIQTMLVNTSIYILVEGNIKGTDLCTFPMYQLRTDEVDTCTFCQTVIRSELPVSHRYVVDKSLLGLVHGKCPHCNKPSAVRTFPMYQPKVQYGQIHESLFVKSLPAKISKHES